MQSAYHTRPATYEISFKARISTYFSREKRSENSVKTEQGNISVDGLLLKIFSAFQLCARPYDRIINKSSSNNEGWQ